MKTTKLFMMLSIFFMVFTSCQNDDASIIDEATTEQSIINDVNAKTTTEQELKLDYHEEYGTVKADEYPMNREGVKEPSLDLFLERGNLKKEDIKSYRIVEDEFSGIGLAQHRMQDGRVIEVPHSFNNEPVYRFEAELNDGTQVRIIIIIICSNGLIIIIWW